MSTYIVAEFDGWFTVLIEDGSEGGTHVAVSRWRQREIADEQCRSLNLHERAEALLALLVESREPLDGDGELEFVGRPPGRPD